MYSNNILNFQESTTISNACTKKSENLLNAPRTSPFGLFEFTRVRFDLKNVAETFQRFMNCILHGLDFSFIYTDDKQFSKDWVIIVLS